MPEYIQDELQYPGGLPYSLHILHFMDASGAIEDLITEPLEHIKNNPDPEYVRLVANNALFSIGKSPNSLLRKSEVAVILGATEETVDQMIQAGTLPEGKNGKFWEAEGIVVKALTV